MSLNGLHFSFRENITDTCARFLRSGQKKFCLFSFSVCGTGALLNKIEALQKKTLKDAQRSKNSGLKNKVSAKQESNFPMDLSLLI